MKLFCLEGAKECELCVLIKCCLCIKYSCFHTLVAVWFNKPRAACFLKSKWGFLHTVRKKKMIRQERRQRESSTLMILLQNILPQNKSAFFFICQNSPHYNEQNKRGLCSDNKTDSWTGFNLCTRVDSRKVETFPCLLQLPPPPSRHFHQLLSEVEVHFVIHILALWIEALQDLCQNVDSLLAAQTGTFSLELLQQVFGGHRFTDQVPSHRFLCQLHITADQKNGDILTFLQTTSQTL